MPQPIVPMISYPGVTDKTLVSGQFTFSHGITPSVCEIVTAHEPSPKQNGTLIISQDGRIVQTMVNCQVDTVDTIMDPEGYTIYRTRIMDRRFLWRLCGGLSGFYNVRWDQDEIRPGTEKKVVDLASLCLIEMKETGYDVSALKDIQTFPDISWDCDNPSEQLARICDIAKCFIVLRNNRVVICKKGVGATLPTGDISEGSISVDPPDPPAEVRIVFARNRWQHDFDLEAVCLQKDGKIEPIDNALYIPTTTDNIRTWGYCDHEHFMDVGDLQSRSLAQESIFRWYRVVTPTTLPGNLPNLPGVAAGKGFGVPVNSLEELLPLENSQIENVTHVFPGNGLKQLVPLPPWVWGEFYNGAEALTLEELHPKFDPVEKPAGFYRLGFSVDTQLGLVKFSNPVFIYEADPHHPDVPGMWKVPARLKLRIACGRRSAADLSWMRDSVGRKMNSQRSGYIQYIKRDDLIREQFKTAKEPRQNKDNMAKLEKQANYYLDAIAAEYQTKLSGSITYPGFIKIDLDGAVQQVSWVIDSNGYAYTRASRNKEEGYATANYSERRLFEILAESKGRLTESDRTKLVNLRRKAL